MSKEEYIEYAECRQASFTYKKSKKFREWSNLQAFVDIRPNDDVLEIIGYLAWEMVRKLTLCTLLVKSDTERTPASSAAQTGASQASPSAKTEEKPADVAANGGSTSDGSPKQASPSAQGPILPEHIFEACRRLQFCYQPLRQFHGGPVRSKLSLVSVLVCRYVPLMIEYFLVMCERTWDVGFPKGGIVYRSRRRWVIFGSRGRLIGSSTQGTPLYLISGLIEFVVVIIFTNTVSCINLDGQMVKSMFDDDAAKIKVEAC